MDMNPITGEVLDETMFPGTDTSLVPLNLAGLSEDDVLALFPTPMQAAGALLYARDVARRAPAALDGFRRAVKDAEKELRVAVALAAEQLLSIYPRMAMSERRDLARAVDDRTIAAQDAVDTAILQLEYARDFDRMIGRDIDILRSLNANLRSEHRS